MTEEELFNKATHLKCMCGERISLSQHGIVFVSADDVQDDSTYELWGEDVGCDDPYLTAVIVSDKPFFNNPDIDSDANIVRDGVEFWTYSLNEDMMAVLAEAGLVDA